MWDRTLIFLLLLLRYFISVDAIDYQLEFINERIFQPCQEHPKNFIGKFFDLSLLKYDYTADDAIHVHGPMKLLEDIPNNNKPLQLITNTFKKQKGAWTNTALNLKYEDLCKSLYNPKEHWYSATKMVPEDKRECPPKLGWEINFDFEASVTMKNVKIPDAQGSYKAITKIVYGPKPNEFMCFEFLFDAHQV